MRVLCLTHSYPSRESPWITPFVRSLTHAVSSQGEVELHLLIPSADEIETGNFSVSFFTIGLKSHISHKRIGANHKTVSKLEQLKYLWSGVRAATRIIRQEKIDLIHAHWCLPSGLVALIASRLCGVPYVVTTHGRDVLYAPTFGYDVPGGIVLGGAIKMVLRAAARVLTTSQETERAALALCPTARVSRIPVGVDDAFLEAVAVGRERRGLLFVGDLVPRKGVDLILDALKSSESRREQELTIVGEGALRLSLEEKARDLGLNVEFLGAVGRDRLREIYASKEALVFSSHIEGAGIVVLEALASGLKVIGAETGIVPELLGNEILSTRIFSFQPGIAGKLSWAMERCLLSEVVSDDQAITAALRSRYSWEEIAERHAEVFREVVEKESLFKRSGSD